MPRQKSGPFRKQRNKKILKLARGYRGGRSKLTRTAKEAVMRAGQYAYCGRKIKKRDYRGMWIIRKALSELALSEPKAFDELVETAKKALA